jgi:hypothetical protein
MNITRSLLLLAAALALAAGPLRADESAAKVAFSDPSKPGTLKIRVWHGEVAVHGSDVKEITVRSESAPETPTPRKDGMRVLSATAAYALTEKNNVVSLDYGPDSWGGGSASFDITVPSSTSVVVVNSAHGDLMFEGLSGNVDVRLMSGDVRLKGISGGAVVETMKGDITADVRSLSATSPLSLSTMHGDITIRTPADAKANIRFRTHHGVILSNYDDKALKTRTEMPPKDQRFRPHVGPIEAREAPEAPEAPSKSSPDSPPHVQSPGDDDSGNSVDWDEVRDSVREAASEAAVAAREAAEALHEGVSEFKADLSGNFPPLPPMTGGKVVSGTLNGGGVEIQAATLKGDIVLKKAE